MLKRGCNTVSASAWADILFCVSLGTVDSLMLVPMMLQAYQADTLFDQFLLDRVISLVTALNT